MDSRLHQLTFGQGISDIDPIYLPDGRILFSSTREPKYCMCNRHIMCNLFTMDADGANIQQIGHSTLFEGHPSLLPDGRVLYDRWEYVDRNFGDAQGAWVCNPDGTNHAIYWGNNTNSPGGLLDNRAIPGTRTVRSARSRRATIGRGEPLAVVDRGTGLDGRRPVVRTWPADAIDLVGQGNYDTFTRVQPKYEDPYPLSSDTFLCSRTVGQGEQMGILPARHAGARDAAAQRVAGLFRSDAVRPPQASAGHPLARRPDQQQVGYFYVADVYVGTGMESIERGSVKSLRVVESPEKRFWTQPAWDGGTGQQAPGMAWDDFNNKRILGTVPVADDGSVYFRRAGRSVCLFSAVGRARHDDPVDAQRHDRAAWRDGRLCRLP